MSAIHYEPSEETHSAEMMYTPLDEDLNQIRILQLNAASDDTHFIECHISIASLDDPALEYEALSYVWGDRNNDQMIVLEGRLRRVTANLFRALQYLRHADRPRTLWVDAICIDQEDTDERGQQVSLMGPIFRKAETVVIWLGEAWPGVDDAFKSFTIVGQNPELHVNRALTLSLAGQGVKVETERVIQALQHFASFAWWGRMWTVQEMVLAQHPVFQCGRSVLDGDLMLQAVQGMNGHGGCCSVGGSQPTVEAFADMLHSFRAPLTILLLRSHVQSKGDPSSNNILPIVSLLRGHESKDPRDKIYGMLALAAAEASQLSLAPDYHQGTENLYTKLALSFILNTRELKVFMCILPRPRVLHLPSWVPDWTIPIDLDLLTWHTRMRFSGMYKAHRLKPADCVVGTNTTSLRIAGSIVDSVKQIVTTSGSYRRKMQTVVKVAQSWPHTGGTRCIDHGSPRESLALILCGSIIGGERVHSFSELLFFDQWVARMTLSPFDITYPNHQVAQFDHSVSLTSNGRRFMLSEGNRMGWVPENTTFGDVIAVLTGSGDPVVLRPGKDGYVVIGTAYVHGIMDGEAMPDDAELSSITLI
ncbi:unnamed protein product [Alternaria alternata]